MKPEIVLPSLTDADRFEDLCLALWKKHLADPGMQRHGRRGQLQAGVDIFGRRGGKQHWVGVQCKVKATGSSLTPTEIDQEVNAALTFNPKLQEFIVATTAARDTKAQERARVITERHRKKGLFSVSIESWDDIAAHLMDAQFTDVFVLFYKNLMVDLSACGSVVGALVGLRIGVGKGPDSYYEFMLGRMPFAPEHEGYANLNYFKNCYFVASLQGLGCDTFKLPVYSSDLEVVFTNNRDRFIICEWLNSLGSNLDDLIRGDDVHQSYCISEKVFREFRDQNS